MKVGILNYGLSNLLSVEGASYEAGASPKICSTPEEIFTVDCMILPGVGSFDRSKEMLVATGLWDALKIFINKEKRPILGICLGMQLLLEESFEGEQTAGLGIIPGKVTKLTFEDGVRKIPHIGYNTVYWSKKSKLNPNGDLGGDYYFVHSFGCLANNNMTVASIAGINRFAAVVEHENVFGVQFHPEKSHSNGVKLLKNFFAVSGG